MKKNDGMEMEAVSENSRFFYQVMEKNKETNLSSVEIPLSGKPVTARYFYRSSLRKMPPYRQINYISRPQSWEMEEHEHDFAQMLVVFSGTLCIECQKRIYRLKRGMASIMPARMRHRIWAEEDYTQFGADIYVDEEDTRGIGQMLKEHVTSHTVLEFSAGLELCKEAALLLAETDLISGTLLASLTDVILTKLMYQPVGEADRDFQKTLKQYLRDHLADNITLEEVAAHLHLSVPHCERLCRRYYGCGVMTLYKQMKISHVCVLLRSTDDPIGIIAAEIGFVNAAHFTNFFKARVGISPTEFRRRK